MLSVMGGIAHAQSIYTYVQQNGEKLGKLGTASFEVNAGSNPTVEFVDGKAVMTIGSIPSYESRRRTRGGMDYNTRRKRT